MSHVLQFIDFSLYYYQREPKIVLIRGSVTEGTHLLHAGKSWQAATVSRRLEIILEMI